jgi:hypothetical protein
MEWNRRNIIVAFVILILGFGGGGAMYLRQQGGSRGGMAFMWFRLEKRIDRLDGKMTPMTPTEMREARRKAEKVHEAVLTKYPSLRIEEKPVPRKRNGFYAMLELAEDPRLGELRKIEFHKLLDADPIDLDWLRKALESFEEVGLEIERVAALPERSSSDAPAGYMGFVPAGQVKTMVDYLLSKALLSAGNEGDVFRYASLAMNLSDHLRYIESPTCISESVLILCRLNTMGMTLNHILPRLGNSANLERWGELIAPQKNIPQRSADMLRGEFLYFTENYSVWLFDEVPDPEKTIFAHAASTDANFTALEKMDFEQFIGFGGVPNASFTKALSQEGANILGMLTFYDRKWNKGLVRSYVAEHYHYAAVDLLIREKAGEDLSKLSGTYVLNPKTGEPFKYDPATRTLEEIPESEGGQIESLKLPW